MLPIFLAGIMAFGGHAAAWAATAPHPPGGRLFRFRLPFEPSTLDWTQGDVPIAVIQNVMRGLYRIDSSSGKVVPDLVQEAQTLEGGKRWKFKLKPGIAWSDGAPLKAQHVVDGLRRLLSPATASSYAYFLFDVTGARKFQTSGESKGLGLTASSDQELEIRLDVEVPYLPSILSHWVTYPIRTDAMARGADFRTNIDRMPMLGPFRIKEWHRDTRLILVQNPKHAGPKPWLERIEAWVIPDDNTAVNLYDTGHLEFLSDPGQAADKHGDLTHRPSPILYFIGIGPGHPLVSTRAGVLALSMAIDRGEIPKAMGLPHRATREICPSEICANALGEPSVGGWPEGLEEAAQPEAARKLLAEAGFDAKRAPPPLTLLYFNRPAIQELVTWIQAQWKKHLGLDVRLDALEPKVYWTTLGRKPAALFVNSKGASYPDPDTFFKLFAGKNPQNLGRWSDPDYDAWVGEASRQSDVAGRLKGYRQASRRVLSEHPALIPLYFRATGYLIKPFVRNLVIDPLSGIDLSRVEYPKK